MPQEIFLLIVIFSMMVITFAIRLIPLHIRPEKMPGYINAIIEYIPAAVISSITVPALFLTKNENFTLYNANILAAIPVLLTAWYSKNLILSVIVGVLFHVILTRFLF
ncbi:AzlD domain-containing protein [Entomobacter blattae]|uniref:Branched-chain amino acid transport protein n=1 Tax=Entomobacter blattae TaxID=2762277 RepID=A0A7H1NRJ6_9PROT|nr:AzlD domain-containing protein [Entomobacter blattae]QNT78406.1 Branched-chain amino acid transport protein [Entomobacter blattae]